MGTDLIHLLTGPLGDLSQCRIACGARAAVYALQQQEAVTCPQCRDTLRRRTAPRGTMAEKALQELVRQACQRNGWTYFHVWNSRHSPSGYPDVTAIRGERLIVSELKRQGQEPTPEQTRWLEAFQGVRTVETYVWTPADVPALLEALR